MRLLILEVDCKIENCEWQCKCANCTFSKVEIPTLVVSTTSLFSSNFSFNFLLSFFKFKCFKPITFTSVGYFASKFVK